MRVRTPFVLLLFLLAGGGCAKKKTTEELIQDLKTGNERDKTIAVRTLPGGGKGDPTQVVPALIGALKERESDVRRSAAIKLGGFGEQARDAIPALQKLQHDGDARVREAAKKALSRIDPERFPPAGPPVAAP